MPIYVKNIPAILHVDPILNQGGVLQNI